jgi:hypothetical protein
MLIRARADVEQRNQFELTARDFAEDSSVADLLRKACESDFWLEADSKYASALTNSTSASNIANSRSSKSSSVKSSAASTGSGKAARSSGSGGRSGPASLAKVREDEGPASQWEVFEWVLPMQKRKTVSKNEPLRSDIFTVPGVRYGFRIVYFPKGIAGAEKRNCSIALQLNADRAVTLNMKVAYYHDGEEKPVGAAGSPLTGDADEIICLCRNFGKVQSSGELAITVVYSCEGGIGCLSITDREADIV